MVKSNLLQISTTSGIPVVFIWIESQTCIKGNDLVDQAAKHDTSKSSQPFPVPQISSDIITSLLNFNFWSRQCINKF